MTDTAYTLVFGLTADPIHKGHLQVILNSFAFAERTDLTIKEFLLVPTYQPNLIANKSEPRTAFKHRLAMCQVLAQELHHQHHLPIAASAIEAQLFKQHPDHNYKSYSYDTLKALANDDVLFVLSADHFAGRWPKFRKWHQWQSLVEEFGLMIHQRPGHRINAAFVDQLRSINNNIYVVTDLPDFPTSSTHIRQQLQNAQSRAHKDLPEVVWQYITHHGLYQ